MPKGTLDYTQVVELADTPDLESGSQKESVSSSLTLGTILGSSVLVAHEPLKLVGQVRSLSPQQYLCYNYIFICNTFSLSYTIMVEEKRCPKCERVLPSSKFNKDSNRADGLNPYCKECHAIYRKEYYQKNKDKRQKQVYKRREKIREWFNSYKKKLKCNRCGFDHIAALDFHHKDDNKEYNISEIVSGGYSKETILKEIEKCEVLCRNCHAIEHWKYN